MSNKFANKFASAIDAAAEQNDYNEASSGGEFTPLPEGPCRLRFVGYVETGQHEKVWQGKAKKVNHAYFVFEVTGPKIEPRDDGQPHLLSERVNISTSEKSGFFKLFRSMNHTGEARIPAQLLGEAFRAQIRHNVVGEGDSKRTYINLTNVDGGWTIAPPFYDDPETGERKTVKVAEPQTEPFCFLWGVPAMEQWDSIFIDGEWEARDGKPAKSKNKYQEAIKSALNFQGSPIQELLMGELDLGDVDDTERDEEAKAAADDAKASKRKEQNAKRQALPDLDDDDIPF